MDDKDEKASKENTLPRYCWLVTHNDIIDLILIIKKNSNEWEL